jgi:hypothetical protein
MSAADTSAYVEPTWFDNLPPAVRHLLFSVIGAVLAVGIPYVQTNYTSWNLPPLALSILGMALPVLVAWLTPLTQQYTLGAGKADGTGADVTGTRDDTTPPPDVMEPMGDHAADPATADAPLDVSDLPADPAV